jgi:hypothetical protein
MKEAECCEKEKKEKGHEQLLHILLTPFSAERK